jgi:copper chaperone CopZ
VHTLFRSEPRSRAEAARPRAVRIATPALLGLLVAVGGATGWAAENAKTTFTITGMTCGGCAGAVKIQLKRTEGVVSYDVSYERGEAEVTYDPAKTGPQKIAESISKAGFHATVKGGQVPMPRDAKSVRSVDLPALKDWFDAAQGSVRFVSLLSPSCPMCQSGHGVLKTVFGDTKSPDLKGFIVWLPMLSGDDEAAVAGQSATFHDDRVGEGWDRARRVGDAFAKALELQGTAWDVYLVYDRSVRWDGADPPAPSFWMHQLQEKVGADPKLCLNPARLRREVAARMARR